MLKVLRLEIRENFNTRKSPNPQYDKLLSQLSVYKYWISKYNLPERHWEISNKCVTLSNKKGTIIETAELDKQFLSLSPPRG